MDEDELSIAVIGISGRFPGAKNVNEFWKNLINEKESISFFEEDELLGAGVDRNTIKNPNYVPARGILGDATFFDAAFFKYSPRDAEILDPQHRIFLECAWHALEDAGYDSNRLEARVGVFAGTGTPWYHLALSGDPNLDSLTKGMSGIIGNEKDYLTNRVSFKLNLTGPSMAVQCACSTSLVAIVTGMQSLLNYQSDMVLAGGVSIYFPEKQGYIYEKGSLDSPDGHCRTFDKQAQGTVFSSGAGVVVLKRLKDALQDNDHIYCTIRSGGINNDGNLKANYTAPSVEGQAALEVEVLEMAGIHPETISYVEAHGTATQLGDPIEIKALTDAFSHYTSKKNYCAIGAVKTNIGHTDIASGVIGLIKVALAMKNKTLPATLHYHEPNPQISFSETPFYVNVKTVPWETSNNVPRRALVNSFGVGGTNACVLVEEVEPKKTKISTRKNFFLPISAKSEIALKQIIHNLLDYISSNPSINLADIAYTLQTGRATFEHRCFLPFSNRDELISKLSNSSNHTSNVIFNAQRDREIIFMFPGQGNQYFRMAQGLYLNEPFFKKRIDTYCDYLINSLGYKFDLRDVVFNPTDGKYAEEFVDQTEVAQPAIFIIELVLAEFLLFLEISPKALVGHSVGEFVCAVIAKVMSVEDALKIVVTRGQLTQKLDRGSMLAIFSDKNSVCEKIEFPIEISVINSPLLTVVSGPQKEIIALEKKLQKEKIACKKLNTSHAFHSHMMDKLIKPLEELIANVDLFPPKIPIMSTVTGKWLQAEEAINPTYWAEHARKPVNFLSAAQQLLSSDDTALFIEVGPGHSLESSLKYSAPENQVDSIALMDSNLGMISADAYLNNALGKIWAFGASINFEQLYEDDKRTRLSLPGYPFQREEYLISANKAFKNSAFQKPEEKQEISNWFYLPSWKRTPLIDKIEGDLFKNAIDTWLVFHYDDVFSQELIKQLESQNQIVISIQRGSKYQQITHTHFQINPSTVEEYQQLFDHISESLQGKLRIIHLWNFQHKPASLSLDCLEESERVSFYEPLFLEQALIKSNLVKNSSITFVANNTYSISGEIINPIKSLLTGPVKVFHNEYPEVNVSLVDIPVPIQNAEQNFLIESLFVENLSASDECICAYRNKTRWVPLYDLKPLEKNGIKKRSLKDEGVYLLTGGLGALGLSFAKYIAENANATILLLQRTKFPQKEQWNLWLENHPKNDPVSIKISKLLQIESLGSQVEIFQTDIASYSNVEHTIKQILSRHGKVSGVIHCAGIPSGGIISLKSPEKAEGVLKSKVQGTLYLDHLLKDQKLDFFILSSSVTSILGEEGQVDYCSANAFLDAFAQSKDILQRGAFTSINWDSWGEIGMAVETQEIFKQAFETNIPPILERKERLKSITKTEKEEVFLIDLNLKTDWFINSHLLHNVPTLVGTTFLEFLNEYAQIQSSGDTCVITKAKYISPFMIFPGEAKELFLNIVFGENSSVFTFFSKYKNGNEKQKHFVGEIQLQQEQFQNQINIEEITERLTIEPNVQSIFDKDPNSPLWLGSRWDIEHKLHIGENEWLGLITLPSSIQNEVDSFDLHPALLDFATIFVLAYSVDDLYLPHSYEEISIHAPLTSQIYSHVIQRDSEDEFIAFDVQLRDLQGKLLVYFKGYKFKKIQALASKATEQNKDVSFDILPDEGIESFKRIFEQLLVPQVIVSPTTFNENQSEKTSEVEEDVSLVQKHARPSLFTKYIAPSNEVEKAVAGIWESTLGIQLIGIDDNFIELGGNSLIGIQVVGKLNEIFPVEIGVEAFLANPTIRMISDYIIEKLLSQLDQEQLETIVSSNKEG